MKFMNNLGKPTLSDSIYPWIKDTLHKFIEHPELWPITEESQATGYDYWVGLKIEEAPHRGDGQWNCYISVSHGVHGGKISSEFIHGDKIMLVSYMKEQVEKRSPELLFTIEQKYNELEDDEDYHTDWDAY